MNDKTKAFVAGQTAGLTTKQAAKRIAGLVHCPISDARTLVAEARGSTAGLKTYTPEMGDAKPEAQIEAHLAHYGEHYFLKSQVELNGRGVDFLRTLKSSNLTPTTQTKVGWHEYKVTMRAFDRICKVHAVACEVLLS